MENIPIQPIKKLIICDPYIMPNKHWRYNREKRKFDCVPGRRPAGFIVATKNSKVFDDPGEFKELELVNKIRKRIQKWRDDKYPNVTGETKQLLEFWHNRSKEEKRLFFCQLEAIETIIWFTESLEPERLGISIPSDGGRFMRLCTKMATGTGKTVVMAMLIAWQVINKAAHINDQRFSKNILIIAPGLTVKKRLDVLNPENSNNYYDEFEIVPNALWEKLRQAKIVIHNWHTLMPIEDDRYGVVKKGTESDYAFARRILKFDSKNIVVINDEAHHAWRDTSTEDNGGETTKWIEGLDKIDRARNVVKCYDFSATPFIPTGKSVAEEKLFKWTISDFSLNDAIESGLTKTPRIAIRDDSGKFDKNYKSRFYHIYLDPEVKPDLNRKADPEEGLPDLVNNAYMLLGQDWLATKKVWDKQQSDKKAIPPVMVTVCNQTSTSQRIEHFFKDNKIGVRELADSKWVLRIDSAKLKAIEKNSEINPDSKSKSEILRQKVNTVGKRGTLGEQLRNIIAVQMITEGWDARNVTHIMGLRAFTSQLLCEQTVGRGLRRMSYDVNPKTKFFEPEYVNIFGVPFTFLPHEGGDNGPPPPPPPPTTLIEPDPEKSMHEIAWPNIDRINLEYSPILAVDWARVRTLKLKSSDISTTVGMAVVLDGKPHVDKMSDIDLYELNKEIRLQRIVFLAAVDTYNNMSKFWTGNREFLIAQLIKLTEQFMNTDKIVITDVAKENKLRTRMTILFNMQSVVRHICNAINEKNVERRQIMLNSQTPIKSTKIMRPWYTKKDAEYVVKNHINLAVYDSGWERSAGHEFERNKNVVSWVKNDHVGFVIKYLYSGHIHDYYPDFIIRLTNNVTLVLEIKGRDDEQNRIKRKYLKDWTEAVNENGQYGVWMCDVVFNQTEIKKIITKYSKIDISFKIQTKCPSCKKIATNQREIENKFGYRNVDGITRPQSWCKKCRSRTNK